jgi:arylsulfatase A-like enzyme
VRRTVAAAASVFALLSVGCSKKNDGAQAARPSPSASAAPTASGPARNEEPPAAAIDAIAHFEDCALGHRGVLIDLGDATARAGTGSLAERAHVESIERDGATWSRVATRTLTLTFTATDLALGDAGSAEPPVIEARVRGGNARSITVYLNGKPAGTWPLVKGEVRVVSAKLVAAGTPNGAQVIAGTNEIMLRFNGARGPAIQDEQASIDWIHVGPADGDSAYGAPTRASALISATLGGVPKRALSLRAPGFARCAGWLPSGGRVTVSLGLAGGSDGDAEVRLLRDRTAPVVLGTFHLGSAETTAWRNVSVPLGDLGPGAKTSGGALGAIELVATRAARGARVSFGEPRVVGAVEAPMKAPITPARSVVLVVMGDLAPRSIEPYGGRLPMPELAALAKAGVTFDAHRASTSVPAGALASMLTGLPPRAHGVVDPDAALPPGIVTLADAVRQAGIVAGMFTANPTTGTAFGFARGWETFLEKTPIDDGTATSVFDLAAGWIDAHKAERFLVVVHARGGHPPWDATPDEIRALAPADYAGGIDPKHAAELLSKARKVPPQIRLNDADRARAWALYALAVKGHDDALGRLLGALKAAGRESDTSVYVAGDAGVDELAHVPFGDGEALDEGTLAIPLVVRPPPGEAGSPSPLAGRRVASPTSSVDLARSILTSLGLTPPAAFTGTDLWSAATGRVAPDGRPELATLGARFALRWGSFVLAGARSPVTDRETKLCDLTLEPACLSDVRGAFPLALEALHREAFDQLAAPEHARAPAVLDPKSVSAVKAWGH